MPKLDEAKTAELKQTHPKGLSCITVDGHGDFVFKRPSRQAFDKWRDSVNSVGASRSALARELAQHCLVFPGWTEFVAMIDDLPGLLTGEVLDACTEGTGLTEKYEVKKL